jgi:poly(A) polymerase
MARDDPSESSRPDQPGSKSDSESEPRIIPRSSHRISRQHIADEALKVLYRLRQLGYLAYLVGGGVRDLYLGKRPKDYDIATDARPSRLKKIFRNCRIIGRRFRIAHVYFPDNKIVEVATFRRGEVRSIEKDTGVILLDNEYGTPEEDAKRRDLTINGLFYDIDTFSIIDYVGGVEDLERKLIRTIKDPDASFQEDPVRMVRALRHASRTEFRLEDQTRDAIRRNRLELHKANPSRLMEEFFRDLRGGSAARVFKGFLELHVLETILPGLAQQLIEHGSGHPLWRRLEVVDRWVLAGREISSPVLLAALLHTALIPVPEHWLGDPPNPRGVWNLLQMGLAAASQHLRIARKDYERVFQVLLAFPKLCQYVRESQLGPSYQIKSYLGDALEFVRLDLESRNEDTAILDRWHEIYVKALPERRPQRRRFARRRRGLRRDRPHPPHAPEALAAGRSTVHGPAAPGGAPDRKPRRRRRRGGRRRRRGGEPHGQAASS